MADDSSEFEDETLTIFDSDGSYTFHTSTVREQGSQIAAKIVANDDPRLEFRRILRETSSAPYARMVAKQASELVTDMILDPETFVVALVPLIAGRLSKFLHDVRMELALFTPGSAPTDIR